MPKVMKHKEETRCTVKGKCFARESGHCTILTSGETDECSFQKPEREVTNGKRYV